MVFLSRTKGQALNPLPKQKSYQKITGSVDHRTIKFEWKLFFHYMHLP